MSMMEYGFVLAGVLLVSFFLLRFLEVGREKRFFEDERRCFDEKVLHFGQSLRHLRLFLVREAGTRLAHAFVFRVLLCVRFIERVLEEVAIGLRAFGRRARTRRLEEKEAKNKEV